jgi:hypothetical protein
MKHVYEPLPPPRNFNPDLPEVIGLVLRALAKDPAGIRRASVQIERDMMLAQLMRQSAAAPAPANLCKADKLPAVAASVCTRPPDTAQG